MYQCAILIYFNLSIKKMTKKRKMRNKMREKEEKSRKKLVNIVAAGIKQVKASNCGKIC